MREIKFRAWDKKAKKMRQVVDMVFNTGFGTEKDDNSLKLIWVKGYDVIEQKEIQIQKEKDFELMQFTGLYDKNGKEIYEGDILQGIVGNIKVKGILGYSDAEATYIIIQDNNNEWNLGYLDNKEVIGNIYENPELLKGE